MPHRRRRRVSAMCVEACCPCTILTSDCCCFPLRLDELPITSSESRTSPSWPFARSCVSCRPWALPEGCLLNGLSCVARAHPTVTITETIAETIAETVIETATETTGGTATGMIEGTATEADEAMITTDTPVAIGAAAAATAATAIDVFDEGILSLFHSQ